MPQPQPQPTRSSPDLHVAVLAFPFGTHAAPLLAVVRRLAAAAPRCRFSFFNTSNSNASVFSSVDGGGANVRAYDVSDGVPEGYVFAGRPQEAIELFLDAAAESFRQGIAAAEAETGRKVSCLVSDAFFWFAAEMAEEMGVAWVPFWTAGADSLSVHFYTDLIRDTIGLGEIKGREDETLKFIPGMSKTRLRDLPEGVLFGNLSSVFSKTLHQMGAALPRATAVFINSFEELDPTITEDLKSKFKNYLNIGPLNLRPSSPVQESNLTPNKLMSWLDKQADGSVVYISFGSVMVPPPHELAAVAEAVEESKVKFIWSLKDGAKVHLPEGFAERSVGNGVIVPWAPQTEVLDNVGVGAFVTHCGWNSVLESVAGEVPMICRPFFGDQRLNGRMVEEVWEIGLIVEGGVLTKDGLVSGLRRILEGEEGKKMKLRIAGLKEQAIKAIEDKGSSGENFRKLVEVISS